MAVVTRSIAVRRSVTKFTHVAFFDRATKANAAQFLWQVLVAFPYRIHTVLTDNGMAFTGQERFRGGGTDTCIGHIFERICKFNGIEKRHNKPYHPWTNGMVERMNRTIKEATIKAYEYADLGQLREHVKAFVQSYNFGKHLKALRCKTPFRAMCDAWEKDSSCFRLHPHHLTVGLNILGKWRKKFIGHWFSRDPSKIARFYRAVIQARQPPYRRLVGSITLFREPLTDLG